MSKDLEKKEIHVDQLCVDWGKTYEETNLHFQQYLKQTEAEGYKIIYSGDKLYKEM